MCNGGGAFSPEEVEYLRSLPVVAEATSRRITYTESFKHNCMRRYHAGESRSNCSAKPDSTHR